jgi:predicted aspartyl protease
MRPVSTLLVAMAACLLADCSPKAQGQIGAQLAMLRAVSMPTDASFLAGGHDTDWTSYTPFDDTRIYLPAQVNGHPVDVMLDSGAALTSIDSAYAEKLGLQPIGEAPLRGTGGDITAKVATKVTIEVAGMRFKDLTVLIFDLSPVAAKIGRPTPVVLGREAFSNLIVDLDLPGHRIAFHDPATWRAPADAVRVSLTKSEAGQRELPIAIEGKAPISASFDLGNGTALFVPEAYAQEARLLDGRPTSKGLFGGVGGVTPETITTLKTVRVAGADLHDVPVTIAANGARAAKHLDLGMAALGRFRLMTDYGHDTLYAIADPASVAAPFRKNRTGLNLRFDANRLVVEFVAPGSPAEATAWKAGEAITAVDGQAIGANYPGSALSRWASGEPGSVVRLTLADGSERRLTLKEYY